MGKINWTTERKRITDLIPDEYNPRKISADEMEHLQESLEKFSVADPIIINKNNRLIGGHQRLKALQAKGIQEVDVRVPDRELTLDEEKELNLRLNRNAGEWDFPMLKDFGEDLIKNVGFTSAEIDRIFRSEKPDEDDAPALSRETNVKLGDVYRIGRHKLMCGDSTKLEDIAKLMGGGQGRYGLH